MSILYVTTIETANGSTDLTLTTGNTIGPAIIITAGGLVSVSNLSTFSNNSTAITGGLTAGNIYKTSNGEIRIVV